MKTTFLIWKNPLCKGIDPDWQILTYKQFLTLIRSPDGKDRHFVKLGVYGDAGDERIVIEATDAEYRDWLKEKRHKQHLRDSDPGYTLVSYHGTEVEDDDDSYGEEMLGGADCSVEVDCFKTFERETLRANIAVLSEDDRRMIEYLYLSDNPGTERGYSELTGIPQKTINDRKNRVIARLQKLLKK